MNIGGLDSLLECGDREEERKQSENELRTSKLSPQILSLRPPLP